VTALLSLLPEADDSFQHEFDSLHRKTLDAQDRFPEREV
jgi:hypothetical protein